MRELSHMIAASLIKVFTNIGLSMFLQDLANAGATKRPTCCLLVMTKPSKGELGQEEQDKLKADYDQVVGDVSELQSSLF